MKVATGGGCPDRHTAVAAARGPSPAWLLLTALFIALTVLAFNFLGDGLGDAADPYASR